MLAKRVSFESYAAAGLAARRLSSDALRLSVNKLVEQGGVVADCYFLGQNQSKWRVER